MRTHVMIQTQGMTHLVHDQENQSLVDELLFVKISNTIGTGCSVPKDIVELQEMSGATGQTMLMAFLVGNAHIQKEAGIVGQELFRLATAPRRKLYSSMISAPRICPVRGLVKLGP